MHTAKQFIASILVLVGLSLSGISRAEEVYYLQDGSRAMIAEGQLFVIHRDSRPKVASPGIYETKDGRYYIIVNDKGVVIRENTKKLR
jgi:hypothetical protein